MMAFVGMFMGGAPGALIASGQAVINLQWQAENRQDTAGASFTVTGPGVSKTLPARADGRAEVTVPVGTYTVAVTHTGAYLGDDPVQVVAESQKSYMVFFDGKVDQTDRITALEEKDKSIDSQITALQSNKLDADATAVRAFRDGNGNNIVDTYATIEYVNSLPPGYRLRIEQPLIWRNSPNRGGDDTVADFYEGYSTSTVESSVADTSGVNPLTITLKRTQGSTYGGSFRNYANDSRYNLYDMIETCLDSCSYSGNFVGKFTATLTLYGVYESKRESGERYVRFRYRTFNTTLATTFTFDGRRLTFTRPAESRYISLYHVRATGPALIGQDQHMTYFTLDNIKIVN